MKTWQDLGLHCLISSLLGGIYFFLSKDVLGSLAVFANGGLLDVDHLGRLRQIWHSLQRHQISLQTEPVRCWHFFHSWLWLVVEIALNYFLISSGHILLGSLFFSSYAVHMLIDSFDKENLKLKNNRLLVDLHSTFHKIFQKK